MNKLSPLLQKQIGQIFGPAVLVDGCLQPSQLQLEKLPEEVARLLDMVDASYRAYTGLQRYQGQLSQDAYADWNLVAGKIDSGFQWKLLLGYESDEIDNQLVSWQKLLNADDLQKLQRQIAEHVTGRIPHFEAPCRMRNKAGDWQWQLIRGQVTARGESGEPARLLVMQRDISVLKDLESERDAARHELSVSEAQRREFLANVGHELRTPINGILGMTELALDTVLTDEQRQYLRTVKKSSEGLAAIVNDLLDFSKLESGKVSLNSREFSPIELLVEVAKDRASLARKKGLDFALDIVPDCPKRVAGDSDRLRQIVANLLDNAIKFTMAGEIGLAVTIRKQEGATVWLEVAIHDTGIGIPADRQKIVFNGFSQADGSVTRSFGGTGLGLAICSRLVKALGGEIHLDSEVGRGTTVRFSVRMDCLPNQESAATAIQAAGKRALVLMENPSLQRGLVRQLEHHGITVRNGVSATEAAIAIARSRAAGYAFDYLFVEAAMPGPGGLELVREWQQAGCVERLVMILEPNFTQDERQHLRSFGADMHLVKPIGPHDVIEVLTQSASLPDEKKLELEKINLNHDATQSDGAKPLKVLVADDSPIQQDALCQMLAGHQITVASHGGEAIEYFEKERFDVILMDAHMPVIDGFAAIEAIRSRELRRSWVFSDGFQPSSIIAMINQASVNDAEQCREAGANLVLEKPLTAERLLNAIKTVLDSEFDPEAFGLTGTVDTHRSDNNLIDLSAALNDIGDIELLGTLASMFVEDWDRYVRDIGNAISQRSHAKLRLHAHELKSVSGIFHLAEVRRICQELERVGEQHVDTDWDLLLLHQEQLLENLSLVRGAMENFSRTRQVGPV